MTQPVSKMSDSELERRKYALLHAAATVMSGCIERNPMHGQAEPFMRAQEAVYIAHDLLQEVERLVTPEHP